MSHLRTSRHGDRTDDWVLVYIYDSSWVLMYTVMSHVRHDSRLSHIWGMYEARLRHIWLRVIYDWGHHDWVIFEAYMRHDWVIYDLSHILVSMTSQHDDMTHESYMRHDLMYTVSCVIYEETVIYEVMPHIWLSRESRRTWLITQSWVMSYMTQSYTTESYMRDIWGDCHIWGHASYMTRESCRHVVRHDLIYDSLLIYHAAHVHSHVVRSGNVTSKDEACHGYEWGVSRTRTCHVIYMYASGHEVCHI